MCAGLHGFAAQRIAATTRGEGLAARLEYVLFDEANSDHCHCSSCNKYCDPRELELMDEVEYCIVRKNKKLAADEIRKLPRRTIPTDVSMIRIGLGPHVQMKKGGKQCGSHLLIITYPVLPQSSFTYRLE